MNLKLFLDTYLNRNDFVEIRHIDGNFLYVGRVDDVEEEFRTEGGLNVSDFNIIDQSRKRYVSLSYDGWLTVYYVAKGE